MSNGRDVCRHRGRSAKGKYAERRQCLRLCLWAYGEQSYDCHRETMEGYLRMKQSGFFGAAF